MNLKEVNEQIRADQQANLSSYMSHETVKSPQEVRGGGLLKNRREVVSSEDEEDSQKNLSKVGLKLAGELNSMKGITLHRF